MTTFVYEAARADGASVRGRLEAPSGADAAAVLSRRGLYPLAVEAARASRGFARRANARSLATVFRSLSSLTDAGVPLQKALRVTARVVSGPTADAVARVEARVREGATLARSLEAEELLFSPVTIGLVRAGERGVGLGPALSRAATQLEQQAETSQRIRAALAYPAVLLAVGLVSVFIIVLVIVPRFVRLLGDVTDALPLATRLLITASELARGHALLMVSTLAGLTAAGISLALRYRAAWHRWALRLPVAGPVRHALATSRVARTLSSLFETGAPALVALDVARETVGDDEIAGRLAAARDRVAEGAALSDALRATASLTPAATEMAAIGDSAGRLGELLARAAELEEQFAERRVHELVSLLEPALILAFAAAVAFVAAALLQALYSLRPGAM